MNQKYITLVNKFSNMADEDKREEILNNLNQLLELLYISNKNYDNHNELLPFTNNYMDDFDYYNALFTRVISLKEETAKLIDNLKNN